MKLEGLPSDACQRTDLNMDCPDSVAAVATQLFLGNLDDVHRDRQFVHGYIALMRT